MQITSPYWVQPDFQPKQMLKGMAGHLGFINRIPWPQPVTVGAIYSGQGSLPDRREMTTSAFGEWFAIDNIIPSSGGVPLINVKEPRFQYSREQFVHRI